MALASSHSSARFRSAHTSVVPQPNSRRKLIVNAGNFKLSDLAGSSGARSQNTVVAIDPTLAPSTSPQPGPSIPLIAAAVGAVGVVAVLFNKLKKKGYEDPTEKYRADMYLADALKDVNTVRIETLSPEQVEAARARRSKERANHRLSLEEVELPSNHPFATKQALSREQQEQALQNLRARSMRRRNFDLDQAQQQQQQQQQGRRGR